MATGLVNGTDLVIQVGTSSSNDVIVAYATSCSLEVSMDEIDQTNKSSGGESNRGGNDKQQQRRQRISTHLYQHLVDVLKR